MFVQLSFLQVTTVLFCGLEMISCCVRQKGLAGMIKIKKNVICRLSVPEKFNFNAHNEASFQSKICQVIILRSPVTNIQVILCRFILNLSVKLLMTQVLYSFTFFFVPLTLCLPLISTQFTPISFLLSRDVQVLCFTCFHENSDVWPFQFPRICAVDAGCCSH